MKRILIILAVATVMLVIAAPALAASLGMSPSKVEVEVPADGSATVDLQAYYYNGDIQITLVDIPLKVTPETVHVESAESPQDVQITIYGDPSLGSKIYDGYIRFTGVSGEMITVAIRIKARVTNLVEGEEPVLAVPATEEETPSPETDQPAVTQDTTSAESSTLTPEVSESQGIDSLSLNTVIIIAAGAVFLGLIVLAISLRGRRKY